FGAALGAARLGMVAATQEPFDRIIFAPVIRETIEPNSDMQDIFKTSHHAFKAAYPGIKAIQ
ncbi:MAG: xylulokinase, partial [Alteromonas macleodii]